MRALWVTVVIGTSVWAAAPKPKLTAEGEALFKEADALRKEKRFDDAAKKLERCVKESPGHYPCYRLLGSVYAAMGTRDQSKSDVKKASSYYQQYLDIAPPDDEYVPRVKAILGPVE